MMSRMDLVEKVGTGFKRMDEICNNKPTSRLQKYRLTAKGATLLKTVKNEQGQNS